MGRIDSSIVEGNVSTAMEAPAFRYQQESRAIFHVTLFSCMANQLALYWAMFDHCLYFNTSALARRLDQEWSEAFAPFALSPPQAFMLRAVLARPGLLQKELADDMSIAKSTATRALDFLVAKGYVARRGGTADAREKCIYPTPEAIAIHALLDKASGAVTARLQKMLGPAQFTETVSLIKVARSTLA